MYVGRFPALENFWWGTLFKEPIHPRSPFFVLLKQDPLSLVKCREFSAFTSPFQCARIAMTSRTCSTSYWKRTSWRMPANTSPNTWRRTGAPPTRPRCRRRRNASSACPAAPSSRCCRPPRCQRAISRPQPRRRASAVRANCAPVIAGCPNRRWAAAATSAPTWRTRGCGAVTPRSTGPIGRCASSANSATEAARPDRTGTPRRRDRRRRLAPIATRRPVRAAQAAPGARWPCSAAVERTWTTTTATKSLPLPPPMRRCHLSPFFEDS